MSDKKSCKDKQCEWVYFDANVWIDWALGFIHNKKSKVDYLFKELIPDDKVLIVSDLVITEVTNTLRKILINETEYNQFKKNLDTMHAQVQSKIKDGFGDRLKRMEKSKIAIRKASKISAANMDDMILKKMKNYVGQTVIIHVCPKCDKQTKHNFKNKCPQCGEQITAVARYDYRGLNYADLAHAYIAQSLGVKKFYSRDRGFEKLGTDSDFKFKVIYP